MRVEGAKAAVQHWQDDMKQDKIARLTNREPENTSHGMIVAIRNSLSDLAISDSVEDRYNEDDEEIEHGKLSEDDEPG